MPPESPSLSRQRTGAALWATPSYGDTPDEFEHVRTTAKQIQVKSVRYGWTERFSRDGAGIGILGRKDKGSGNGVRELFDDKAACLRHMALRARQRAESMEKEAAKFRAWADERQAEARALEDANEEAGGGRA